MKDLTDEQLNIAICEWRGWAPSTKQFGEPGHEFTMEGWGHTDERFFKSLPSHITGIEALGNMQEATASLSLMARQDYAKILIKIVVGEVEYNELHLEELTRILHATARQRAIALLRVVRPDFFS